MQPLPLTSFPDDSMLHALTASHANNLACHQAAVLIAADKAARVTAMERLRLPTRLRLQRQLQLQRQLRP